MSLSSTTVECEIPCSTISFDTESTILPWKHSVDYVIKLFLKKSGKSRFPPKLKQQVQTILKVINSFRV